MGGGLALGGSRRDGDRTVDEEDHAHLPYMYDRSAAQRYQFKAAAERRETLGPRQRLRAHTEMKRCAFVCKYEDDDFLQ